MLQNQALAQLDAWSCVIWNCLLNWRSSLVDDMNTVHGSRNSCAQHHLWFIKQYLCFTVVEDHSRVINSAPHHQKGASQPSLPKINNLVNGKYSNEQPSYDRARNATKFTHGEWSWYWACSEWFFNLSLIMLFIVHVDWFNLWAWFYLNEIYTKMELSDYCFVCFEHFYYDFLRWYGLVLICNNGLFLWIKVGWEFSVVSWLLVQ